MSLRFINPKDGHNKELDFKVQTLFNSRSILEAQILTRRSRVRGFGRCEVDQPLIFVVTECISKVVVCIVGLNMGLKCIILLG